MIYSGKKCRLYGFNPRKHFDLVISHTNWISLIFLYIFSVNWMQYPIDIYTYKKRNFLHKHKTSTKKCIILKMLQILQNKNRINMHNYMRKLTKII